MIQVTLIPAEGAVAVWPKVRAYLQKAADYTYGRYEVDDILISITDMGFNLWVAFDEEEVLGAVVTCFRQYPRKRYLDMTFIGGEEHTGLTWKEPMIKTLQHWAYDNYCDGIESSGRPGWAKIFKDDGYKMLWHTYELPAAENGLMS